MGEAATSRRGAAPVGAAARKTFNIVRQVTVDDDTLRRIAELLGIPVAERDRIISGEIVIGAPPTTPGGSQTPGGSGS
jgi:hypothetical protein